MTCQRAHSDDEDNRSFQTVYTQNTSTEIISVSANLSVFFFFKCQLLPPTIVYQFVRLILVLFAETTSINSVCQPRDLANETLQQQIPPPATQSRLTACITAKLCRPLLGHGIWRNTQLIITCENVFRSAFLSVWRMTFTAVWRWGGGHHRNKLEGRCPCQRWSAGGGDRSVWDLAQTHTHTHYYI